MRGFRAGLALALVLVGSVALAYPVLAYGMNGTRSERLTAAVDRALDREPGVPSVAERPSLPEAGGGDRMDPASPSSRTSPASSGAAPGLYRIRPILEVPALRDGQALGILTVPAIGLRTAIFEGTARSTLLSGPGHLPWTAVPGADGVSVIAAHRDLHFRNLKDVRYGNRILLELPTGTTTYRVTDMRVAGPSDTEVAGAGNRTQLRLLTCWPPSFVGPAPQRLLVAAVPMRSAPAPAPELPSMERGPPPLPTVPRDRGPAVAELSELPIAPAAALTEVLPLVGAGGMGVASLASVASVQGDRRRGWFVAFVAGIVVLDAALAFGFLG